MNLCAGVRWAVELDLAGDRKSGIAIKKCGYKGIECFSNFTSHDTKIRLLQKQTCSGVKK